MQLDVGQTLFIYSALSVASNCLRGMSLCLVHSSSDAHDSFAECFIGCRQRMRRRRATATRELQHDTSLRKFFVLGALVPAMLLATWWCLPPLMTGGVGNPKQHSTFSSSPDLSTPMHSNPPQVMFSDGRSTSCEDCFDQLCGPRATFLLLCFHVGHLRVHVETSCCNDSRGVVNSILPIQ